jgi:RNA polymerase sigma-70 factor (family 1)
MNLKKPIITMDFPISLGNRDNFDLVFRAYHQALVSFACTYVDNEMAEDVVSNVFFRLWQNNHSINDPSHLKFMLYRAVRNACLNNIKVTRNSVRRAEYVASESEQFEPPFINAIIHAEVLAEIYRAINMLPSQCAKVITMSYVDGLSNSEIAAEMGLSEQTVKNHKGRGLKILKESLSNDALMVLLLLTYLK